MFYTVPNKLINYKKKIEYLQNDEPMHYFTISLKANFIYRWFSSYPPPFASLIILRWTKEQKITIKSLRSILPALQRLLLQYIFSITEEQETNISQIRVGIKQHYIVFTWGEMKRKQEWMKENKIGDHAA